VDAQDDNSSGSDVAEGVESDYHRTDVPYEVGNAVQFCAGACFDGEGKFEAGSQEAIGLARVLRRMTVRLCSVLKAWFEAR